MTWPVHFHTAADENKAEDINLFPTMAELKIAGNSHHDDMFSVTKYIIDTYEKKNESGKLPTRTWKFNCDFLYLSSSFLPLQTHPVHWLSTSLMHLWMRQLKVKKKKPKTARDE